jgi:hypothetical protein
MPICPKDFKPCMDDLCYAGNCILMGIATLSKCSRCGQIVGEDIECDCPPEGGDEDDWDDEED